MPRNGCPEFSIESLMPASQIVRLAMALHGDGPRAAQTHVAAMYTHRSRRTSIDAVGNRIHAAHNVASALV